MQSRWMPVGAVLVGFLEASFVPFPIEPLVIPAMLASWRNAFFVAALLTAGDVAGALLMYALGALAAEPLIEPLFARFGALGAYEQARESLRENGFLALVVVGITPIPFQAGTAAAGAIGYPLPLFVAAVVLSRGARFAVLATLVSLLGARAGAFVERHETTVFVAGLALFLVFALLTIAGA